MKTSLQLKTRLVLALGLTALSASSFAATTVYSSSASFMAQLEPGSYTETFTSDSISANYASGGFSYTLSAPGGLYSFGEFIESYYPESLLTITFTSGNVTALGGNFFSADLTASFEATPITLTLSDGTTVNFTPQTLASSYRGFTSTAAINSITISSPTISSLDNLTVGVSAVPIAAAVPEPETYALMALGLLALGVMQRRRVTKKR